MEGAGGFASTFTDIGSDDAEAHPFPSMKITLYTPLVVTIMSCVIALVDHELPFGSEEDSVTESPEQKVVGPLGVITGAAGIGFTVMVTGAEAGETHPFASVAVTV